MTCDFRIVRSLDTASVIRLYTQADWWEPGDAADAVERLLKGSFRVAAAFDGDRLIGMARSLSDGASDAYIQDVVVDPAYRKQGIGGKLVRLLLITGKIVGKDANLVFLAKTVEKFTVFFFAQSVSLVIDEKIKTRFVNAL